jgi:hypothetical protein
MASPEPTSFPTWSPDGSQLAYVMSFSPTVRLRAHDVGTGKHRLLANFRINSAPAWSWWPTDGSQPHETGGSWHALSLVVNHAVAGRQPSIDTGLHSRPADAPLLCQ